MSVTTDKTWIQIRQRDQASRNSNRRKQSVFDDISAALWWFTSHRASMTSEAYKCLAGSKCMNFHLNINFNTYITNLIDTYPYFPSSPIISPALPLYLRSTLLAQISKHCANITATPFLWPQWFFWEFMVNRKGLLKIFTNLTIMKSNLHLKRWIKFTLAFTQKLQSLHYIQYVYILYVCHCIHQAWQMSFMLLSCCFIKVYL